MNNETELRQIPLSLPRQRLAVERLLADCGLRLETVDYYVGVFVKGDDTLVAGGGLQGAVIKCVAVTPQARDGHIANALMSHLISHAAASGHSVVRLFTKPEYLHVFESMSFRLLAKAPKALLLETGIGGIDDYCRYLQTLRTGGSGHDGVIVMHANPFTRGHLHLITEAARQVPRLYVIAVKEENSDFSYAERTRMIRAACAGLSNVVVVEGSDYAVSKTTFPTYFLKRLTDASDTQMQLDIDLFRRHIAPALRTCVRFVGSEPDDALTRRYNELMAQTLDDVHVVERLTDQEGYPISATRVRKALREGRMHAAMWLVPSTSIPFLIAHAATVCLQAELDCTPKPGLIDRHDNGAHTDMSYDTMKTSIRSLRPYLVRLALAGSAQDTPTVGEVRRIGMEAEQAMLSATHGVNTHRGALFAIGLAVVAAAHTLCAHIPVKDRAGTIRRCIMQLAGGFPSAAGTHGSKAAQRHPLRGALQNARDGYPELFSDWLPYYAAQADDVHAPHRTLLRIMTTLDDTNVVYRAGYERAQRLKQEARDALNDFSPERLRLLNEQYIREHISPGGSADMLSLTLFLYTMSN